MNLDLSGIFKFILDFLNDVAGDQRHLIVAYDLGLNHDSYLSSRLNCERLFNSVKRGCYFLEFFKTLDIVLYIFPSCARTRR